MQPPELGAASPPSTDGGIVAEILSKHSRSAQPESQQLVAVTRAVCDVVTAEGLQVGWPWGGQSSQCRRTVHRIRVSKQYIHVACACQSCGSESTCMGMGMGKAYARDVHLDMRTDAA
jgi:hypothetical protein